MGPFSCQTYFILYPDHYNLAFAFSDLPNPQVLKHSSRSAVPPRLVGNLRGFHVPCGAHVDLGACYGAGGLWAMRDFYPKTTPVLQCRLAEACQPYLMRLGHCINALCEFTKKLKKHIKDNGVGAMLKLIKETLFSPWLPNSWYEMQSKKVAELRLQLE